MKDSSKSRTVPNDGKRCRIYVAEEQDILREAYRSLFTSEVSLEVADISDDADPEVLLDNLSILKPDALVWGIKTLQADTLLQMATIRRRFPDIGMVILFMRYDTQSIPKLRSFNHSTGKGCAFLLKHSMDDINQLTRVVNAVVQGQIILDPTLMESITGASESRFAIFNTITHREMMILSLMAKGYRNAVIADILHTDPKTIQRHENAIYTKLNASASDTRHPRVHAVMLYLKATGQLTGDDLLTLNQE